jgi:hypothetical protein
MSINPLPAAPQRTDGPAIFPGKADAWVAALGTWTTQVNQVTVTINGQTSQVATNTANAASSAIAAAASASSANTSAISAGNSLSGAQVAAAAAQAAAGLPSLSGKAGYVLTVDESAQGVEWRTSQSASDFETAIMFGV